MYSVLCMPMSIYDFGLWLDVSYSDRVAGTAASSRQFGSMLGFRTGTRYTPILPGDMS